MGSSLILARSFSISPADTSQLISLLEFANYVVAFVQIDLWAADTYFSAMSDELRIGLTTCDNADVADRIAFELVERSLAACVKIDPNVRSVYRYKGEIQDHSEIRLMVKFAARNSAAIESFIKANHPYIIPEWIVLRPESVCQKYLEWATE